MTMLLTHFTLCRGGQVADQVLGTAGVSRALVRKNRQLCLINGSLHGNNMAPFRLTSGPSSSGVDD